MSLNSLKIPVTLVVAITVASLSGQPRADSTLLLQPVADNIYAIVGDLGNRSPGNLGNNATFGFVVTGAGVVLIDSGGTLAGAEQIDALIASVTEQPVVRVINTGGQDHRWLGNGYFKARGAQIIASEAALGDQKMRSRDQLITLANLVGDDAARQTDPVYADITFTGHFEFELGDTLFELHHAGPAHTPGDSYVWLPRQSVLFSGDIVYIERMLGVGPQSNSRSWIEVFEIMAAQQPRYLVPGHGPATDLSRARRDTYDYLVFLRGAVADFIDDDGDMSAIGSIDQAKFDHLRNFDEIAGRNAQQVFSEMEWE
jgi:glyoxylase-like metal-dependent hydrolase (beta-lactamase superfamily II)